MFGYLYLVFITLYHLLHMVNEQVVIQAKNRLNFKKKCLKKESPVSIKLHKNLAVLRFSLSTELIA